ncbi:universal stress protein [Rhodohalobacter halophilus]|uniref:universal stress protein n=1 Tax=Rhodohalobacter halophilus TaxID=1812810 RepID=UPI00083F6549|nr:universal stress protein [Rhodohalobacter halophilus]
MSLLFKHAIVAIDLSEASELIVSCVPHLKKFGLKKVTLVNVVPIPYSTKRSEFSTKKNEEKLDEYKKQLVKKDLEVDIEIRSGVHFYPPTEVIEAAHETDADFIVIGNRGHSKVQEMLMGSTATEVLHRSDLPVYLINMEVEWFDDDVEKRKLVLGHSHEKSLKHVMHPTDFSKNANRAFEVVKKLDKDGLIDKVSLVHVQGHHAIALKDPVSRDELTKQTEQILNELRDQLSDKTRENSSVYITFGTPAKEIISAAEENGATMLIMGSQGKGFVERFFIGGVSNQVTRLSKVPILLVPAERE